MPDFRTTTVQAGYDRMASEYQAWASELDGNVRLRFLPELTSRLDDGVRVLDLGCGAGVPATQYLSGRFKVTGVDISEEQLRLARTNVPDGEFVRADFSGLELDAVAGTFDAITAFYSISHVPRERHETLLHSIANWLTPGGFFLATLGASDLSDWHGEWLDVPMFFSSHDADTNRELIASAGLKLVSDEVVTEHERDRDVSFLWVLAQKPGLHAGCAY